MSRAREVAGRRGEHAASTPLEMGRVLCDRWWLDRVRYGGPLLLYMGYTCHEVGTELRFP
jgi:hypothetical protein